jgi:hypothetical protein
MSAGWNAYTGRCDHINSYSNQSWDMIRTRYLNEVAHDKFVSLGKEQTVASPKSRKKRLKLKRRPLT